MYSYCHIKRLEFLVTRQCSGRCRHCCVISAKGDPCRSYADLEPVLDAIRQLGGVFNIDSVMTYGGEPLLYPDVTAALHKTAMDCGVIRRELITNGYFSNDAAVATAVVEKLLAAGVNDIKVSIDAFHQEYIPERRVEPFVSALLSKGFRHIAIHPAWLVSPDDANDYNKRTRDLIERLSRKYRLAISRGNIIVLSGQAKDNLWSYYADQSLDLEAPCGQMVFTNSLSDIKTLRILPNGDVALCRAMVIGNLFQSSIDEIVHGYSPNKHSAISLLLSTGLRGLHQAAERISGPIDIGKYRSSCDLCADCVRVIGG